MRVQVWQRGWAVMLVMVAVVGALAPGTATLSANVSDEERAAAAAIEVAVNVDAGDAIGLHDRLHPDLRDQVPLRAFATWLDERPLESIGPDPRAEAVASESFTLDATGARYQDAQRVTLVGSGTLDVVMAEVDGRWRWLPELTAGDLAAVTAAGNDEPVADTTVPAEYQDIERFWTEAFAIAGHPYAPLQKVVPVSDPSLDTACGPDIDIRLIAVYYCDFDQTIYFDPAFAARMTAAFGEFAWLMVISHEWGHHVQAMLSLNLPVRDPELDQGLYVIESELLSDCLAGLYFQDLIARGDIGEAELDQAIAVAQQAGDGAGTTFDDGTAHGSGEQRVEALRTGLEDGFAGCHLSLEPAGT